MSEQLSLEASLAWHTHEQLGRSLLVTVRNAGPAPAPRLGCAMVFEYEARCAATGEEGMAYVEAGYFSPEPAFNGTLAPGRSAGFFLFPGGIENVRRRAAELAPECYWISVRSGDREVHRVPGAEAGAVIERDDG